MMPAAIRESTGGRLQHDRRHAGSSLYFFKKECISVFDIDCNFWRWRRTEAAAISPSWRRQSCGPHKRLRSQARPARTTRHPWPYGTSPSPANNLRPPVVRWLVPPALQGPDGPPGPVGSPGERAALGSGGPRGAGCRVSGVTSGAGVRKEGGRGVSRGVRPFHF